MKIYFVRHGDPDYAHDTLTSEGHRQAKLVANYLKDTNFDYIYSSPLNRAKTTASYLANLQEKDIIIEDWASEDHAGKGTFYKNNGPEGNWLFRKPFVDILKELQDDPQYFNDPRIKSKEFTDYIRFLNNSVDNWLLNLGIKHDRFNKTYDISNCKVENIIIFAHGGMSMAFMPSLLDVTYAKFAAPFVDHCKPCAISVIEITDKSTLLDYDKVVY